MIMEPQSYLSPRGKEIFQEIVKHCNNFGIPVSAMSFELSILSNSYDLYERNAVIVNSGGGVVEMGDKGYRQVSPEYTIMKNEYANIQKHGIKFGLNPLDFEKIMKAKGGKPKEPEKDDLAALQG